MGRRIRGAAERPPAYRPVQARSRNVADIVSLTESAVPVLDATLHAEDMFSFAPPYEKRNREVCRRQE